MKAVLFRALVFTHRYIGIGVGWLMLLWCVSGMVMLYVRYPQLTDAERYATLSTLDLSACCSVPKNLYDADAPIAQVQIESLSGRPVLWVAPESGPSTLLDLRSGMALQAITRKDALQLAQDYLITKASAGQPQLLDVIERDQWTVPENYDEDRPLYHLALHDTAGTELYVSSSTGRLVQKTERATRFWNWLGAVPHWLYFTALRQHAALWTQVVIWSSLLGTFLAVFGLYLGVVQLRRKADGRWHSPYRRWKYWHHVPGLIFGVFVLTWVVSGLLSMNPWGWLETTDAQLDARQVRGAAPNWSAVQASLAKLSPLTLSQPQFATNTVSVQAHVLNGELFYVANTRNAEPHRLTADWNLSSLNAAAISTVAMMLNKNSTWSLLTHEDDYHYSHGLDVVSLPVLRVMTHDAQDTRYYLDPMSGELLDKIDSNARWYRWLHRGLHRLDFTPLLRVRPLWDLLIGLLLLGATLLCATGVWLGIKYLSVKRSSQVVR